MRTHAFFFFVANVQSVWYNISALIRCNFIIKNYVNRKIKLYIYLLIFTISLWLHVKHFIFLFCRQCYRTFPRFSWSLVDVLTRIVLTGNYKTKIFSHFPFSCFSVIKCLTCMKLYWFCKYPKINILCYFTIYIIFKMVLAS
jgi:hypothetical protein